MKIVRKEQLLYIVKDIIDIKRLNGIQYCLVWWQGFPKKQATWEPIQNMTFLEHWQDYYRQLKRKLARKQQAPQEQLSSSAPKNIRPRVTRSRPLDQEAKHHPQQSKQSNEQKVPSELDNQPPQGSEASPKPAQTVGRHPGRSLKKKGIRKQKRLVRLAGQTIRVCPVRIDLELRENGSLPLADRELLSIRRSFIRNSEMWYQVELVQGTSQPEQQLVSSAQVKLLWPRQLAQFLLSKIK